MMKNRPPPTLTPLDSPTINGMELQYSTNYSRLANTASAAAPSSSDPSTSSITTATTTTTTTTVVGQLKTSIHVTALDGIVNVNSLFTMAIFIGFSLTVPEAATAGSRPECTTSRQTVRRLIVFEVVSFSFFLFSSLIAQSLKLSINLLNNMEPNDPHKADIDPKFLKYGLFGSAIGSVMGCLFLMLSIVDFIQVKLGEYSCGGKPIYSLVVLVIFVGSGLVVYVTTAVYVAFFVEETAQQNQS